MELNQYKNDALRTDLSDEQYREAEQRFADHQRLAAFTKNLFDDIRAFGEAADQAKRAIFYGKEDELYGAESRPHTKEKFAGFFSESPEHIRLMHGALGMFTEACEMIQAVEKMLNNEFDDLNLVEEIGDQSWYVNLTASAVEEITRISYPEMLERNIAKLRARYPDKFSGQKALDRDVENERKSLDYYNSGEDAYTRASKGEN